jgi:predicted nucleotidyltransferase
MAARNLELKFQAHRRKDLESWERASREAAAIVSLCVEAAARRVYQWGSVLRPEQFHSWSDIDVAVEGLPNPEAIFRLQEKADTMASFPVHLVELEKLEPEYADSIRQTGKLVYGGKTGN